MGEGKWPFPSRGRPDEQLVQERVIEGRWDQFTADQILKYGELIKTRLRNGERWWDQNWTDWNPNPAWHVDALASGWDSIPRSTDRVVIF